METTTSRRAMLGAIALAPAIVAMTAPALAAPSSIFAQIEHEYRSAELAWNEVRSGASDAQCDLLEGRFIKASDAAWDYQPTNADEFLRKVALLNGACDMLTNHAQAVIWRDAVRLRGR